MMTFFRFVIVAIMLLFATMGYASGLVPESLSPFQSSLSETEKLIKILENDQARQALIHNLKLLIKAQNGGELANPELAGVNLVLSDLLQDTVGLITTLKNHFWSVIKIFKPSLIQNIILEFLWMSVLAISVGYAGEWLFLRLFQNMFGSLQQRFQQKLLSKTQVFIIRSTVHSLGLLIFTILALIVTYSLEPQMRVKNLIFFTIGLASVFKLFQITSNIILSPSTSSLMLVSLKETTSQLIYRFQIAFALALGFVYGFISILDVFHAPKETTFFVVKVFTFAIGALILYYSGCLKPYINGWISSQKLVEGRNIQGVNRFILELARSWYPMVVAYVLFIIFVMLSSNSGRYQTHIGLLLHTSVAIIMAYVLILISPKGVRFILKKIANRHPLIQPRLRVYRRIFSSIILTLIAVSAVIYCTSLWKLSLINDILHTQNQGFVWQALSLLFILLVGIMAWEINELWIERKFNPSELKRQPASVEALKRLKTLQPLIRNTVRGFIVLFVMLMFFSELGLNIAPLLAGASVFGIALSLGGQTLVKDIITGSFILIEDTMNLGDYVEISGHSGRIESMSLRTVTLRDSSGGVHSIPFSSINTIVNLSKTFSVCIFNFTIDHTIDIETVRKTLQSVDKSLRKEKQWAPLLLDDPLEILGVTAFDDGGYTVRAQLRVEPGKQWMVEREINWRFAKAFAKEGIKSPLNKQWVVIEKPETKI